MFAHEIVNLFFQQTEIRFFVVFAQLQHESCALLRVLSRDALQNIHKKSFRVLIHGAGHAEIKDTDDIIRKNKNIARMRIGMEESEFKHLFHDKIGAAEGNGL